MSTSGSTLFLDFNGIPDSVVSESSFCLDLGIQKVLHIYPEKCVILSLVPVTFVQLLLPIGLKLGDNYSGLVLGVKEPQILHL